jgi:hypothetical protein
MNRTRLFTAPLLFLLLANCAHATLRKSPLLESAPPRLVVVMPTDAGYAPPEAAQYVRDVVAVELARRGYQTPRIEQVDPVLRPDISAAEIASAMQADAVLYTRITQYALDRSVFNTRTTFGMLFTLYDATGAELWVAALDAASDSSSSNPIHPHGPVSGIVSLAVDAANANAAAERPPFADVATHVIVTSVGELPKGPLAQ